MREVLEQAAGADAETDAEREDARAEASAEGEAGAAEAVPGATPRSAFLAFLRAAWEGDDALAARFLDTRSLTGPARGFDAEVLARQLGVVLTHGAWIDPESLSNDPEGRRETGLPASQELVKRLETREGEVPILLQRGRTPEGETLWRFAASTVSRVPALYEEFGYGPLSAYLPHEVFEWQVFGIQVWKWVGLFCLLLLAGLVAWVAASLLHSAARLVLRERHARALDFVASFIRGPLRLAVGVGIFAAGQFLLNPSVVMSAILRAIEQTLLIAAFTWACVRIVDAAVNVMRWRLVERNQTQVLTLLPPGSKTLKLLILLLAVLVTLDNFGFDVTALIAGLGVGGIAVALAAQKTVENLFGGITLFADRPVGVGDFCRFGDNCGTVEEIGLRSTRIRTNSRTLVSVPNADFSNLHLENYAARDRMWYHPTIGLRYETTPDQIRYILVEVRRMLYAHPRVHPDGPRIRFTNFGAYSLDLEVFAYVDTRDYAEYLEIAEDLNLRIMDIVADAGSGFAFPSQTTYLEQGEPLSPERRQEIEARVAKWREDRALYLPRFPRDEIRQLDDTLDYPDPGAPKLDAQGNPVRKG